MMRSIIVACAALAGCASNPTANPGGGPDQRLGFDPANMAVDVRPQDDFYRYVNGTWLTTTQMPQDKSNYGSFTMLHDLSRERLRVIVEEAAGQYAAPGSDLQKVGDFYRSFMNTDVIDAAGARPIARDLMRVANVADQSDLAAYFGLAPRLALGSPLRMWVNQDAKNTGQYIVYMSQGGLGLPDRDYYFNGAEKFVEQRASYVTHMANMFRLAGFDDEHARAQRVMALETRLAEHHWDRTRNRDRNATYNKLTLAEAATLAPGLDWQTLLGTAGFEDQQAFVVRQPDYITALATIMADVPLGDWRDYLRWNVISNSAAYLSAEFVAEDFDFYSRTLRGVEQNRPRWKRGVAAVEAALGEVVGRIYVERHFRPEAKARMDELVENLRDAFEIAIDDLAWMSPGTKRAAQEKLAKFTPKIGYPDKWKDYSKLTVGSTDLLANVRASRAVEYDRRVAKLGGPIDRGEWFMSPQTVNAYYNPLLNEIVFPAAILQPPFFDLNADDAINYGAIVAVIGHEFSHGFDDQGRKSDGDGNLRDWWTQDDASEFEKRAAGLVDQYAMYNPIDDMHVNGKLTLGENIGDLAGLTMAYKAYRLSLGGKEPPVMDGFSGDQRFFIGWSQVWRRLYRDDELRNRLLTDSHSPSEYRVNGIVANMPQFQRAFDVKPGDKLYKPVEEMVVIW